MSRTVRSAALFAGIIFVLALGGVLASFLWSNAQWVSVNFPAVRFRLDDPFFVVSRESPLWLVMTIAFALGLGAALLLIVLPGGLRRGVERRRERRFISGLEGELADLRNLPMTNPAPLEDVAEERLEGAATVGRAGTVGTAAEAAEEEERALLAAALQDTDKGGSRS